MKLHILTLSILLFIFLGSRNVLAAGPLETFVEGCQVELETYCKDVTPGDGRVLACIFAHEDKISGRCEYALYDAAAQLEQAIAALVHVTTECLDDIQTFCADTPAGDGRIAQCLSDNEAKLSQRCKQAAADISR